MIFSNPFDDLLAVAVWLAAPVLLPEVGLLHHLPALKPCLLTGAHILEDFISFKVNQTRGDRDKPSNLDFGLCFFMDHSLSQRLLKHFFDNVLLEHVGLIHVLTFAVHVFFC